MMRTAAAAVRRNGFDHDLAIVGAGFAGLACARSAARRGLSVVVLERQAWASAPDCERNLLPPSCRRPRSIRRDGERRQA
jgi:2-polyprenyl-6-methoxyphenol hydroxylase-like FAD-dependent oxidoreductase